MKEYTTYELIEDQQGNLNLAIFLEDACTFEELVYIRNIAPERVLEMLDDIENWKSWKEWKKSKGSGLAQYYEEQNQLGSNSHVIAFSYVNNDSVLCSMKYYDCLREKGLKAFRIS